MLILIVFSSFSFTSLFLDNKSYQVLAQSISSQSENELLPFTILLNQVEKYMPDASIVLGIVSPNGTQLII